MPSSPCVWAEDTRVISGRCFFNANILRASAYLGRSPQSPVWVSLRSFPPLRPRRRVAACPALWASRAAPCSSRGSSLEEQCWGLQGYYQQRCPFSSQLPLEGSAAESGSPPVWRKRRTPRCSPCCGHLEERHAINRDAFHQALLDGVWMLSYWPSMFCVRRSATVFTVLLIVSSPLCSSSSTISSPVSPYRVLAV